MLARVEHVEALRAGRVARVDRDYLGGTVFEAVMTSTVP